MTLRDAAYRSAIAAARPLLTAAAPFHAKLARGVAGRRDAVEQLVRWADAHREDARPLVWLHAPSVGEALMAQAIVSALRRKRPGVQIVFTFFSPSAERIADHVGADVAGYLPWDSVRPIARAVDALRPQCVAYVRSEVWPTLSATAAARGARVALVNAVLPATSSRLRAPARALLSSTYRSLDLVGAVNREHADRYSTLGVQDDRIHVAGDARFDQVWARVHGLASADTRFLERLRDARTRTLVAGSTWPADERVIVTALGRLPAAENATWRVIFAPHEPSEKHLAGLARVLERAGLSHARLAAIENSSAALPDAVIVDRLGVLADLYGVGDAAYVGGGFSRAGLHSVVEPAALAVPVLFGPRQGAAREASELAAAGGGIAVGDAIELARELEAWGNNAMARSRAGDAALAYVRAQLGGAQANAELIAELMER